MPIVGDVNLGLNLALGGLFGYLGLKLGRLMSRNGATANDIFKGKEWLALVTIGLYIGLLLIAVNLPQMQTFPLEWRFYGMRMTWILIRSLLCGAMGVAIAISWKTARIQLGMIGLVGLIGFAIFTGVESHFLSPIYSELEHNLRPNRVVRQTSASSCAPSALATVLQHWGITSATEPAVAKAADTSRMGTTMPQVIQAAKAFGMTGIEMKPTWEQMRLVNRPGVLSVWQIAALGRKLPHAVALMAIDDIRAIVADPATGKYHSYTYDEFQAIWRQEYVPIFKPEEVVFSGQQALKYLKDLGYGGSFESAVKKFQEDQDLRVTGILDPQTALMISGSRRQGVPTLKPKEFEASVVKYMQCEGQPDRCQW